MSAHRARNLSRRLAMQALYQWQVNPRAWQDIHNEHAADQEAERVDREYFKLLLEGVIRDHEGLDALIAANSEIRPTELDPVEHALLWVALYELKERPEVPYRVVIAESVQLAKQFGATDGHKFVNAVLDKAARSVRADEYGQP